MKMWGFIALALGVIIWFAGDKLSAVGADVDSLIANKWFASGLIAVGGIALALESKAFSKL
jgi:hypothetical protein